MFSWSDNSAYSYHNFIADHPDYSNGNVSCVSMGVPGAPNADGWVDLNCTSNQLSFVCKRTVTGASHAVIKLALIKTLFSLLRPTSVHVSTVSSESSNTNKLVGVRQHRNMHINTIPIRERNTDIKPDLH